MLFKGKSMFDYTILFNILSAIAIISWRYHSGSVISGSRNICQNDCKQLYANYPGKCWFPGYANFSDQTEWELCFLLLFVELLTKEFGSHLIQLKVSIILNHWLFRRESHPHPLSSYDTFEKNNLCEIHGYSRSHLFLPRTYMCSNSELGQWAGKALAS